ncbi:guanine nucleotide-exchange factor SEC12 [Parasteatoda tepidariorum]|uniref:guanine nucleotide-exchange factor SEC12 n=1 Tax=Parasteatoda tepidariorum TaxID=114398 RepID=UPI00077F9273|nr:prolactin regulatory element-binding protein [Parasteatoda tepidariorum]
MTLKKQSQLLARVNFPLYTVQCLSERHVLVAGGGGGAKTGVPNVIQIYELIHDGVTCRAESITHYETGSEATRNCAIHDAGKYKILFAGMEGNCHTYKIKHEMIVEKETIIKESKDKHAKSTVRKRIVETESVEENQVDPKKYEKEDANANVIHSSSKLQFCIHNLDSFQTDFSEEPFQKVVRFSRSSSLLTTAGADGHIRIWKFPELKKIHDIEAHSDEVDDLDICPLGKKIVSISRDGHGKIWNAENGSLVTELNYVLPSKSTAKYIFRSCRFGIVEDKNDLALFATLNPRERSKPPMCSYICKWDTKEFLLQKIVSAGKDMLTTMAISDNGHFIGLGTLEGSVKIYIAFSLQKLYNVNHVHGIFVTGLEFLPTREETRRITGGQEASLISISVDNHIVIHHIPMKASIGYLTFIMLLIIFLFLVFVMMDYFNL